MSGGVAFEDGRLEIQEWWNYHHRGQGDYKVMLTGSRGPEVWRSLNISSLIKPGRVVLNIGVGFGYCTRELARRGCVVHALDISSVALAKVEPFTVKTWLPSSLPNIPQNLFDLAISHLVTQHMADKELLEQISGVLHSLKPCGIFAMQFAFAMNKQANDLTHPQLEQLALMKGGGMCRSLEGMLRLVDQAGGSIVWARRIGMFPKQGSGWYAIHIVRSDCPQPHPVDLEHPNIVQRAIVFLAQLIEGLRWPDMLD